VEAVNNVMEIKRRIVPLMTNPKNSEFLETDTKNYLFPLLPLVTQTVVVVLVLVLVLVLVVVVVVVVGVV
jgi:hypothetical protein